ncbi:substrate-binding periplasmic protein [Shewanella colwelliana]|uniref:substrate-binding periplasmic protein n=1 Tax=Shewanella colwelliana TaxID=23 RepID=UPI00048F6F76|nr:ABC transporter substrate-binding protein [Shewanella colwelliana]
MSHLRWLIVIICCLLFSLLPVAQATEQTITFCVEDTEFPPFNYFQRENGKKGTSTGYDIDLLNRVFSVSDFKHQVIALPWRRCLKDVKEGTIDAAMSASLNPERSRDFLSSAAYYHLTPSYFFLKFSFPDGVRVHNLSDLRQYGTICGIKGFNYQNFGITKNETIYEIRDLAHLPEMLQRGRCQFFLARKETLSGTLAINSEYELSKLLRGIRVPGTQAEPFHMLISHQSKYKHQIKALFDSKVASLRADGELQRMLEYQLDQLDKIKPSP